MKKSNWIIFGVLVVASVFFLWLWYYLQFNLLDNPLDLVLTIIWWAVVALGCFAIHKAELKRQERIRTSYIANTAVFNSEAGLVDLNGAAAVDALQDVLENLKYNFVLKDFPSKDQAKFDYVVRTSKFEVAKNNSEDAAEGQEAQKEVKTWEGEVARVAAPNEDPKQFSSREELAAILV